MALRADSAGARQRSARHPSARERSARDEMIAAAERLFGARGIGGVSLREIGAAAGQRNNSAAAYHFGSKDGLVDAILDARMRRIDERRRAMLADLEAAGRGRELHALVEALVLPLAEGIGHEDGRSWYARFLAQAAFRPGFETLSPARHEVTRGLAVVVERLEQHLRELPAPLRGQRLQLAALLVVAALADQERQLDTGSATVPTSVLAADLVDAVAAVLAAPVSPATTHELRRSSARPA